MKNLDIQVGDRVTYKKIFNNNIYTLHTELIIDNFKLDEMRKLFILENVKYKLLKIERSKYEVIEEKKELLTEEEKEFLTNMLKYYEVEYIHFNSLSIELIDKDDVTLSFMKYPEKIKFNNEKNKKYTLKELGLEE